MYWLKEVTMNKLSVSLLLAASLFLIEVSPAVAHSGNDGARANDRGHHAQILRRHDMPRWLRRNDGFRHWYRRSPLSQYRRISWNQLFDIYRFERRYFERRFDRRRHVARNDDWRRDRRRHRDDD